MSVRLSVSFCPSVRPSTWNNSAPTGRIFIKFDTIIFRKYVEKIKISLNSGKNNEYFTWRLHTCMIVSHSVLLIMRNVSDKYYGKNLNTYFMFNNLFFGNSAVYEIKWKNVAEPDSPHMTIRRMRLACWITKVTNLHSEYVILIAFLLQQCLHDRA